MRREEHFSKYKKRPTYVESFYEICMMETVGRADPCFRHGTDYILNLHEAGPPAYYAKYDFGRNNGGISHPSATIDYGSL